MEHFLIKRMLVFKTSYEYILKDLHLRPNTAPVPGITQMNSQLVFMNKFML